MNRMLLYGLIVYCVTQIVQNAYLNWYYKGKIEKDQVIMIGVSKMVNGFANSVILLNSGILFGIIYLIAVAMNDQKRMMRMGFSEDDRVLVTGVGNVAEIIGLCIGLIYILEILGK